MVRYKGKGVGGAIAIGRASVYRRLRGGVRRRHIEDAGAELSRYEAAKELAGSQLYKLHERALREAGAESAEIFEAHRLLLYDNGYNRYISDIIRDEKINAEYAVFKAAQNFAGRLAGAEDAYIRERAADIEDVSNRLIDCLSGARVRELTGGEKSIVCAENLTPGEVMSFDKERSVALVLASGALNSHTAILARDMDIPAVVGAGDDFLNGIEEGDELIVDGSAGDIIVRPDNDTKELYKRKMEEAGARRSRLLEQRGRESVTRAGSRIRICANIGSADGIRAVIENDADGVGLFRSELLYLERDTYPSEDELFEVYKRVLKELSPRQVIIRTLDIGADKRAGYFGLEDEPNPALGLRGIRLSLAREEVFKVQLRALYRASVFGKLGIMFPMITGVGEVEKIMEICRSIRAALLDEGISFDDKTELGIMIETPAAAILSDRLAPLVDFFSVGTNDLTQYTLAVDRQNERLAPFCDTDNEAVLRLIGIASKNAHEHGTWIGICGELAADTSLTETFISMGIDELSVSPAKVLSLRERVREL